MRIFPDTVNLDEIRQSSKHGVCRVTTNPSLIAKEKKLAYKFTIKEIQ